MILVVCMGKRWKLISQLKIHANICKHIIMVHKHEQE